MRILHLVHQYPPEFIGGTERYTMELAEQQALAGHAVAVFAPTTSLPTKERPVLANGIIEYRPLIGQRTAHSVFAATFSSRSLLESFVGAVREFKPALVHIEHLIGLPLKIIDQIVDADIPFIVTLHDYWFICANAQLLTNYDQTICSGPDRYLNCARCALVRSGVPSLQPLSPPVAPLMAWRNKVIEKALIKARRLIAPTRFVKAKYLEFFDLAEKVVVIPHGIRMPELPLIEHKYQANRLNISYVGGLSWQKGVHVLIEAVNMMPEEDVWLGIYGDTSAFPQYVADLSQMIRHPGIKMPGQIDRGKLWSVLSKSDVVVVPSLWYETASLIVQEAFAARVPVVASRIGALQERVVDEHDGLLVAPGDARSLQRTLMQLYKQPELRLKLRSGIQPVRTIEDHASAIENLYRTVLHEPIDQS
ncbi:MAG: glycosyltransferase family 4 protein [Anaerolineae bacterium]|nr:MAG: glycosyltransferase family 4 protein [Anaerolineae bacterium]